MLSNIERCIENWDLNGARICYERLVKKKPEYLPKYIKFLYECGELEDVLCIAQNHKNSISLISNLPYNDIVNILTSLCNDKIENINIKNYQQIKKEILDIYLLNYKMREFKIDVNLGVQIIADILKNNANYANTSIVFAYTKLFTYFEKKREWQYFFKIKDMTNWLSANLLFSTYGLHNYHSKLVKIVNETYNCQWLSKQVRKPKIAVCMAGICRGFFQVPLEVSLRNLIKPLNADLFIFAWDQVATWNGMSGGVTWTDRNFPSIKPDPVQINTIEKLNNIFTNTFNVMNKEYYKKIPDNYFSKYNEIKGVALENQVDFEQNVVNKAIAKIYNRTEEEFKIEIRRHFTSQLKLFYGLSRCKDLILDYEKTNNFKYDYIIRIRVDSFPNYLNITDLTKLNDDELACGAWFGGMDDRIFYGKRNAMIDFLSLFDFDKEQNFKLHIDSMSIPKNCGRNGGLTKTLVSNHGILVEWLYANKLRPVSCKISGLFDKFFHISSIPDFSKELEIDIANIQKNSLLSKKDLNECLDFFNKCKMSIKQKKELIESDFESVVNYAMLKRCSIVDEKFTNQHHKISPKSQKLVEIVHTTLYKQDMQIPATIRIQNQLTYKLGKAIIENSKSLWGYIRMPYVLSYIAEIHNKELANRKEKLPKIETLPDYKEALKYKEHLSYKLGECFIKNARNWYKGGLIKFYFEAKKLQKERKK